MAHFFFFTPAGTHMKMRKQDGAQCSRVGASGRTRAVRLEHATRTVVANPPASPASDRGSCLITHLSHPASLSVRIIYFPHFSFNLFMTKKKLKANQQQNVMSKL